MSGTSNEPWRCAFCKRLNKAVAAHSGKCETRWERCIDIYYICPWAECEKGAKLVLCRLGRTRSRLVWSATKSWTKCLQSERFTSEEVSTATRTQRKGQSSPKGTPEEGQQGAGILHLSTSWRTTSTVANARYFLLYIINRFCELCYASSTFATTFNTATSIPSYPGRCIIGGCCEKGVSRLEQGSVGDPGGDGEGRDDVVAADCFSTSSLYESSPAINGQAPGAARVTASTQGILACAPEGSYHELGKSSEIICIPAETPSRI